MGSLCNDGGPEEVCKTRGCLHTLFGPFLGAQGICRLHKNLLKKNYNYYDLLAIRSHKDNILTAPIGRGNLISGSKMDSGAKLNWQVIMMLRFRPLVRDG